MITAIIIVIAMALFDLFLVLACAKLEDEERRWERHHRDWHNYHGGDDD